MAAREEMVNLLPLVTKVDRRKEFKVFLPVKGHQTRQRVSFTNFFTRKKTARKGLKIVAD